MKTISFLCILTLLVYFLSPIFPIVSFSQQTSENNSLGQGVSETLQKTDKSQEREIFLPNDQRDQEGPEFLGGAETFDSSESVRKFLSSFAILLIALLAIFFVLRFVQKKRKNRLGRSSGVVEVLEQSSISGAHSIQLVQIAEKIYILATSQSNVSLIRVVEDPDELRELRELCEKEKGNLQEYRGFGDILHSYLPRGWKKSVPWGFHSVDLLNKQNK